MRWNFRRTEKIRRCYVSGHTAYKKAFRRILLCISRGKTRNRDPNQRSPHLSGQLYRDALSIRTWRPINHSFVVSVALFVFLGIVQGADLRLLSKHCVPYVFLLRKDFKDMNTDMKVHVIGLLENYPGRERQIALLHYEMQHTAHVLPEEVIEAMSLGHGDGMGGSSKGHISDKTMYIALNYQEKMDRMNTEAVNEVAKLLLDLEAKQDRLRYYVSLLKKREAEVIRLFYMEQMTMDNVEKEMHLSAKTLRKLKNQAVDALTTMYEFAANGK